MDNRALPPRRFIVAEPIAAEFERKFVERMESLSIGDPFDEKTELGPLATADAVTSLDADVQKTVKAGAKRADGRASAEGEGKFLCAHGVDQFPKGSPAYGEEFFGPVASIFRAKIRMKRSALPTTYALGSARVRGQ